MYSKAAIKIHLRKLLLFIGLLSVCLLVAFYIAPVESQAAKHPLRSDFIKLYKSTVFFWRGEDIYQVVPVEEFKPFPEGLKIKIKNLHPNLNPPLLTLLMSPLGLLSYHDAFVVWWGLSLACGIGAAFLIWSTVGSLTLTALLSLLILMLAYSPTMLSITMAQLGLLLLLLCAVAWRALRSGRESFAGLALGLAFGLKLFAGFFVVMLVAQRRWLALAWFLGTFLAGGILAGIVIGFESYTGYLSVLSQVNWYAASWNGSFLGFFSRIFGGSENLPMFDWPRFTHTLNYLFAAGLTFANFLLALNNSSGDKDKVARLDFSFALSIISMLLLSPLGWVYYFPVLLIPFWVLWNKLGQLQLGRNPRALLVFAWILSTVPRPLLPSAELNDPIVWFFDAGVYFYSLILFATLLLYTARRFGLIQMSEIRRLLDFGK